MRVSSSTQSSFSLSQNAPSTPFPIRDSHSSIQSVQTKDLRPFWGWMREIINSSFKTFIWIVSFGLWRCETPRGEIYLVKENKLTNGDTEYHYQGFYNGEIIDVQFRKSGTVAHVTEYSVTKKQYTYFDIRPFFAALKKTLKLNTFSFKIETMQGLAKFNEMMLYRTVDDEKETILLSREEMQKLLPHLEGGSWSSYSKNAVVCSLLYPNSLLESPPTVEWMQAEWNAYKQKLANRWTFAPNLQVDKAALLSLALEKLEVADLVNSKPVWPFYINLRVKETPCV